MNNDTPADAITQADIEAYEELNGEVDGDWSGYWLNKDAALQILARHRTTSLAAQDVPIRLRYEYAKGATIEDMRSNLSEQLRNAGDCKLMWVNEGDLGIVEMMAASPAPSLAAQDGLVDALRGVMHCNSLEKAHEVASAALASIEVKS